LGGPAGGEYPVIWKTTVHGSILGGRAARFVTLK